MLRVKHGVGHRIDRKIGPLEALSALLPPPSEQGEHAHHTNGRINASPEDMLPRFVSRFFPLWGCVRGGGLIPFVATACP